MKENLFSCSNTSKNAFLDWARSPSLSIKPRDSLFLFLGRAFIIRPPRFCPLAVLLARKWCKGKVFFCNLQIFRKLFSKNFQNPSLTTLKHHFQVRKRVQSNGKKMTLPNVFSTFFLQFLSLFLHSVRYQQLTIKDFIKKFNN